MRWKALTRTSILPLRLRRRTTGTGKGMTAHTHRFTRA